jgi:spermidine synthase
MNPHASQTDAPGPGRFLLYATVVVSGGAVMILELLGTRIIGPFYGVSLYVWSSLIAVTLISLALGYFVGGYAADRFEGFRLAHVIALAAAATVVIPFLSGPVLGASDPLGIRAGGFVSALVLFTLPLTLLAMVGPFVIKLATRDLLGVGTAAGTVYAVSTLGSVAATLLLGFYLLPRFGTRSIVFSLSLVLLVLAAALAWADRKGRAGAGTALAGGLAVLLVLGLAGAGYAKARPAAPGFKVLEEAESTYGWVRVVDDEKHGYRMLLSDASVLSAMELARGRPLLGYQALIGLVPLFRPDARDALLIGLGGGHVATDLKSKGLATDTIEIDPAVADMAQRYFRFRPTGDFIVGDARYEIKRLHRKYDLIVHDCFTGGSEPTHMLSREMLGDLRGMLTERGVLALNYVGFSEGEGADAVASVYATLQSLFPHIRVFFTDKAEFTDFIFVASREPLELDPASGDARVRLLLDHERGKPAGRGIVITDDYNPMESLQVRKAETYRKLFLERVSFDLLLR